MLRKLILAVVVVLPLASHALHADQHGGSSLFLVTGEFIDPGPMMSPEQAAVTATTVMATTTSVGRNLIGCDHRSRRRRIHRRPSSRG